MWHDITGYDMLHNFTTDARPIWGKVVSFFILVGFFTKKRSNTLSFLVRISVIWCKLWSDVMSNSCWWCLPSGLPVISDGTNQSIWPKLKSHSIWDDVILFTLLSDISSCSNDVPSSEDGL